MFNWPLYYNKFWQENLFCVIWFKNCKISNFSIESSQVKEWILKRVIEILIKVSYLTKCIQSLMRLYSQRNIKAQKSLSHWHLTSSVQKIRIKISSWFRIYTFYIFILIKSSINLRFYYCIHLCKKFKSFQKMKNLVIRTFYLVVLNERT